MSQIERLFWRADYEIFVKIDGPEYRLSIPREHLEIADYDGEDIHKVATEFVLDGLEERNIIGKDLRKLLYLHVFNSVLRQLPLKPEKKTWVHRLKKTIGW